MRRSIVDQGRSTSDTHSCCSIVILLRTGEREAPCVARSIVLPLDLKPCRTSQLALATNDNSTTRDTERQHQHLTRFELDGLDTLCTLLRKLKDKSIPEDLLEPQQLLATMEVRHRSREEFSRHILGRREEELY